MRKKVTERHKKLALLWADDQITLIEIVRKLNITSNTAYSILARALKEIYVVDNNL